MRGCGGGGERGSPDNGNYVGTCLRLLSVVKKVRENLNLKCHSKLRRGGERRRSENSPFLVGPCKV